MHKLFSSPGVQVDPPPTNTIFNLLPLFIMFNTSSKAFHYTDSITYVNRYFNTLCQKRTK